MYEPWKKTERPVGAKRFMPGGREVKVVLSAASWVWLTCALATFHSGDASIFHHVIPAQPLHNWCGALGANIAALLFVTLGSSAWLLLFSAVFIMPRRVVKMRLWARGLALGGIILSMAALLQLSGIAATASFSGGMLGRAAIVVAQWIGVMGTTLLYTTTITFSSFAFAQRSLAEGVQDMRAVSALLWRGARAMAAAVSRKMWKNADWLWYRGEVAEAPVESEDAYAPVAAYEADNADQVSYQDEDVLLASDENNTQEATPAFDFGSHYDQEDDASAMQTDDAAEPEAFALASHQDANEAQEDTSWSTDSLEAEEYAEATETEDDFSEEAYEEDTLQAHADDTDEDDFWSSNDEVTSSVRNAFDDDDAEAPNSEDELDVEPEPHRIYKPAQPFPLPHLSIFMKAEAEEGHSAAFIETCEERGRLLEEKLTHFGIAGTVRSIRPGPVITVFEYEPEIGSKVSRILALEDDLALSLKAYSIRILAPVPGKNVVGFEIANEKRSFVNLRQVVTEGGLQDKKRALPITLGVDTTGNPVISDLTTMPHLLVAGATGSGKSVGMNVMLVSLLASLSPEEVRIILIDPKRLEFAPYADVPHLLFPIVTNPFEVAPVLKWVVSEMEMRYEVLARAGVRNIGDYRKIDPEVRFRIEDEVGCTVGEMPYIVVMVDELADLMMVVGKEVEMLIARIAQMARAAGIHMIVATQRPSVDVVTGIIKVNFPSRLAFRVSTKVDSRTIVDGPGAEKLLGKGDMLYMSPASPELKRLHGPFVTDEEINDLTTFLKEQRDVEYLSLQQVIARHSAEKNEEPEDDLYPEICSFLETVDEVSISLLQRKYRVGFNRSARLIEMLERDGKIAPAQGSKPRRVLRD